MSWIWNSSYQWKMEVLLDHNQTFEQVPVQDMLSNSALNWCMFGLYLLGLVVCLHLALVSLFEKSGLAGPHRTILNQLVALLIDQVSLTFPWNTQWLTYWVQGVVQYVVGGGMDQIRQLYGPLPPFVCKMNLFLDMYVSYNLVSIIFSITLLRVILVCFFKAMPTMDDNFISRFIFMSINLVTNLHILGKLYTDRNYNVFEVCTF